MNCYKSRRIQTVLLLTILIFAVTILFRLAFYFHFIGADNNFASADILRAWSMGLRFDFRLSLLLLMPVYIVAAIPKLNLLAKSAIRKILTIYLSVASLVLISCYIIDFSYFAYLGERTDASILRFLENPTISGVMVWESYPVISLSLLSLLLVTGLFLVFRKVLAINANPPIKISLWQKVPCVSLMVSLVFIGLVGNLKGIRLESIAPLRWSEAYFSSNKTIAALALNPVLFFYDTYKNQPKAYNENIVTSHYPIVKNYLGINDLSARDYYRHYPAKANVEINYKQQAPNIVLVMLESLGANRLGAFGNELNPTPNIDAIIKQGHFFKNFYVPSSGTARTVFGKITGIPDVSNGASTASRNPQFVNQQVVANTLENYQRFYFLGGGAHWANIRGILVNNIENLNLYEEGMWQGDNVDVWGISDRSLFKESHQHLLNRDKSKPFFAVIQTAANHRPFTIPNDDSGFIIKRPGDARTIKEGFISEDQYNAVRLLDFNIGYYINELVANSDYGDNTIFLFYGDHNDKSNPSPHLRQDDTLDLTPNHVPFFIYAPGLLKEAKVFTKPMGLVDMIPTAASLAGVEYTNTTLGRDIYSVSDDQAYALLHIGDRRNNPSIALFGDGHYLRMLHDGSQVSLHDLKASEDTLEQDVGEDYPDVKAEMKALLEGLYNTALYMMANNSKL